MSYRYLCEALLKGEPYVGPALRALQGDPERQRYFRPVVNATRQFLPPPLDILEIGSWAGVSTISWGVALTSSQVDGTITCVDPWLPYFDTAVNSTDVYREMNEAAERNLIYKLFEHNITSAGLHNVVHVKKGTSREVLADLPAATWAIVYVDGSHTFEDVMFDLCQAKRLLRNGGILCGDDLELQREQVNPSELANAVETGQDYVLSHSCQRYYHPGVTAAVGEAIGKVFEQDGFWAVRVFKDYYEQVELDFEWATIPTHISKFLKNAQTSTETSGPRIVDVHRGFNIVRFQNKMYGLRQAIGEVDTTIGEDALRSRYSHRDLVIGTAAHEIKTSIDNLDLSEEMLRRMDSLKSEVSEKLAELQQHVERINQVTSQQGLRVNSGLAKIFPRRIWRALVRMGRIND